MSTVGIIGLGLLGSAIASRLKDRGFDAVGFDIDPARRAAWEGQGGSVCQSAQAVFDACPRTLLSLPTSAVVRDVLGAARLSSGVTLLDTTTGDPSEMTEFGETLARKGVHYLDATVAGSSAEARTGDAVIMVGGDADAVAASRDVLESIARQVFHLGRVGSGARMKLVVNLVLGLNRAVLAEGLAFARASGLDLPTVLDVLRSGPAASRVMETKGPKMLSREFAPVARLSQHLKDVLLILNQGARLEARIPFTALHRQILESLVEQGYGGLDNAAVLLAFGGLDDPCSADPL